MSISAEWRDSEEDDESDCDRIGDAIRTGRREDDEDEPDDEDELEDEPDEDLSVEIALDSATQRLACVYTRGLWWLGLPELYVSPPKSFSPGPRFDWSRLAFILASSLVVLGHELIDVDHFALEPYEDVFNGETLQVWLGQHEVADGLLAEVLAGEVDTVIRVDCSLWSTRPQPERAPAGPSRRAGEASG